MMPFSEKLSFLIHLAKTTNKELAAELSVDPLADQPNAHREAETL